MSDRTPLRGPIEILSSRHRSAGSHEERGTYARDTKALFAPAHDVSVEDATEKFLSDIGIERYGRPEEIADLMAFLVSLDDRPRDPHGPWRSQIDLNCHQFQRFPTSEPGQ